MRTMGSKTLTFFFIKMNHFSIMNRDYLVQRLDIKNKQHFLPIDVREVPINYKYYILLIGVLNNGEKACLFISGIKPFFELEILDDNFVQHLHDINYGELMRNTTEIISKKRFKFYYNKKFDYIRIYFNNTYERNRWMNYFYTNQYRIGKPSKGEPGKGGDDRIPYILASNDATAYYRKFSRDYKIKLNDWMSLEDSYHDASHKDFVKNVKNVYTINCKKLKNVETVSAILPILELSWDIETFSKNPSIVPQPDDPKDKIFMISCSLHWINKDDIYINYVLTTLCIPNEFNEEFPDIKIKYCKDEKIMVATFLKIIKMYQPDIIIGFNDYLYDWPFLINKIHQYDLRGLLGEISIYKKFDDIINRGRYIKKEEIKIEATRNSSAKFIDIPGIICIDIRVECMKGMPTTEYSNLKYYLQLYLLEPKVEISINVMRELYIALHKCSEWDYTKLLQYYNKWKTLISYSMVDSISCHRLATQRNIYGNIKETANLSYTCFYDAFFRAGGMRVKNLIMAEANDEYTFDMKPTSEVYAKYPGARVITPTTRLYKYYGDSPITMIDYSSLYPNIIITYNFSQETTIVDEEMLEHYDRTLYYHHEITFNMGDKVSKGWILRYINEKDMGVCPRILLKLYNKRMQVKKEMKINEGYKSRLMLLYERSTDAISVGANDISVASAATTIATSKIDNTKSKIDNTTTIETNCAGIPELYNIGKDIKTQLEHVEITLKNLESVQYAIKIYMNTFYGDAGNNKSVFYIPTIAGGITQMGQLLLQLCIDKLTELENIIVYGDTDSVYSMKKFSLYDDVFDVERCICSESDKIEYWTQLINRSLQYGEEDKNYINECLKKVTGHSFLKMEFEGVLFPAFIIEKKNYVGVKYTKKITDATASSLFTSTCKTIDEFKDSDGLLVKGLEIKKRGTDLYTKTGVYTILKEMFSIHNTSNILDIIKNSYISFANCKNLKMDMFIKTAQYKESTHDTHIKTFIERLRKEKYSNIPELNERFNYVVIITKKEELGLRTNLKISDKMVLYEEGKLYKIDIDYYVKNLRNVVFKFIKGLPENINRSPISLIKEIMEWGKTIIEGGRKNLRLTIPDIIDVTDEVSLLQVMIQYIKKIAKKNINNAVEPYEGDDPEYEYEVYISMIYPEINVLLELIRGGGIVETDNEVNSSTANTASAASAARLPNIEEINKHFNQLLIENNFYKNLLNYYKNVESLVLRQLNTRARFGININDRQKMFPTARIE